MRFLNRGNLGAEGNKVRAKRIERSGSEVLAVVDGVDGGSSIPRREDMVESSGTEILTNRLQGTAENFGNRQQLGSLAGKLFNDVNGNGTLDTGESGIAGRDVFIDTNQNGTLDLDELDVPRIGDNRTATIIFDAFPGQEVKGNLASIAPLSTNRSGRTIYEAP